MAPLAQLMKLSAERNAFGPLTLIIDIAPVPGMVAGAQIVSSFFDMNIKSLLIRPANLDNFRNSLCNLLFEDYYICTPKQWYI